MRTATPDSPADTSTMRIVHQALRRDLHRAEIVLGGNPPAPREQQRATARHLAWMMSFLHAHHRSEDDGLYPLVRERDAAAAELLDAMDADHRAVASGIADVETAAGHFLRDDGEVEQLSAAVANLSRVLLPHLEREENQMMPVVSAVVTDSEWRDLEEQYNLKGKPFAQLGFEGHWLIDNASPEDRQRVVRLVPAIPRFILVHGFARSYRRRAAACWGTPGHRRSVQMSGQCHVVVDADLDAVWNVVRDVARVGDWSHECIGVSWLDGATAATPGARFRGRNKQGLFRWGRVCEIVSANPYELVWRTVPTALYPDSTEWRIRLSHRGKMTHVEQSFTVVRGPKLLALVYGLVLPAHRDRTAALTEDLRRLGDLAVRSNNESVSQR
jgi:Hemerythrin HHE cation binding domain/Polyketide cyclase / dehydrase and lipid transport